MLPNKLDRRIFDAQAPCYLLDRRQRTWAMWGCRNDGVRLHTKGLLAATSCLRGVRSCVRKRVTAAGDPIALSVGALESWDAGAMNSQSAGPSCLRFCLKSASSCKQYGLRCISIRFRAQLFGIPVQRTSALQDYLSTYTRGLYFEPLTTTSDPDMPLASKRMVESTQMSQGTGPWCSPRRSRRYGASWRQSWPTASPEGRTWNALRPLWRNHGAALGFS